MTATTTLRRGELDELVTTAAEELGVCTRPVVVRRTDTVTEQTRAIGVRCGTTRAQVCRPCAERNRAVRMTRPVTAGT